MIQRFFLQILPAIFTLLFTAFLGAQTSILLEDDFDDAIIGLNTGTGGGFTSASSWSSEWLDYDGDLLFDAKGGQENRRALAFSTNAFNSDTGFRLTIAYSIAQLESLGKNTFSFGFISSETDLQNYTGLNPFGFETGVYSFGVNLTEYAGAGSQGLNFSDASVVSPLDVSGTAQEFSTGESVEVVMEIGQDGVWNYSINGVHEASGMIADGFDLTKNYHVAVYAQDTQGGPKAVQSVKLEERLAQGERADWMRGTWGLIWTGESYANGYVENISIKPFLEQISELRTLSFVQVKLGSSYIYSPVFSAPHDVIESLWQGDTDANGDFVNLAVPRKSVNDPFLDWITELKTVGLKTQIYVNSSNMLQRYDSDEATGRIASPDDIPDVTERWKAYCDANYQEFIDSRDYHTGIWDRDAQAYVDASVEYSERKYMFCFAEFILKEYAVRYGDLLDSWMFDSGSFMTENGDENRDGILEEQRIYEAFALAVRAGNPNAAIAFNNGPNRDEDNAANGQITPFSQAVHFDDYMFGHPYNGGNNIGDGKEEVFIDENTLDSAGYPTNYGRNYAHMLWMQETNGNVQLFRDLNTKENEWGWDDKVVGNFNPPMSTTAWNAGSTAALEDEDFNLWNSKAINNGGAIIWGAPMVFPDLLHQFSSNLTVTDWGIAQLLQADTYFQTLPSTDNPGAPVWARAEAILTQGIEGESYFYTVIEGIDFWDSEGDAITAISLVDAPSWMTITESETEVGTWIIGGIPTESEVTEYTFALKATDINGLDGDLPAFITINPSTSNLTDLGDGIPVWADPVALSTANPYYDYEFNLTRGREFDDFDGDELTLTMDAPSWLSLNILTTGVWQLSGMPQSYDVGEETITFILSDGLDSITKDVVITVADANYLPMLSHGISGDSYWIDQAPYAENGNWTYNNRGTQGNNAALLYSEQSYRSEGGLRLTVAYTIETLEDLSKNNFAFGLISDETDFASYDEQSPFGMNSNVYSLGVNYVPSVHNAYSEGSVLTPQGLNFTNGTSITTVDNTLIPSSLVAGLSTEAVIEIKEGGLYSYSIGGSVVLEGLIEDFDLSKSYHVVAYGRDDEGGIKSFQRIALETIATASMETITLDGVNLEDFDTEEIRYTIELPAGTTALPEIKGIALDENATVTSSVNGNLPEATEVTLTVTGEDGLTTKEYTLIFTVKQLNLVPLYNFGEDNNILLEVLNTATLNEAALNPDVSQYADGITGLLVKQEGNQSSIEFNLMGLISAKDIEGFSLRVYAADMGYIPTNYNVMIGVRNSNEATSTQVVVTKNITATNEWVDMVFDFTEEQLTLETYDTLIVLFSSPDSDSDATGTKYYIDDLKGPVIDFYSQDASLSNLTTNGQSIVGFDADTTSYNIVLPEGSNVTDIPVIAATANDDQGQVSITQATTLPGEAIVTVTAVDGITIMEYLVHFSIEVFTLPSNNFKIKAIDETCFDIGNGSIEVLVDETLDYIAKLTDLSGEIKLMPFQNTLEFSGLEAGSYLLCFTVADKEDYEKCFTIVISQPEPLAVTSDISASAKFVTLHLTGGTFYNITLNDESYLTEENEITLPLVEGINQLSITTDKECQGMYEELIQNSNTMVVYPNPVTAKLLNIVFAKPSASDDTILSLHSPNGLRIMEQVLTFGQQQIQLNLSGISQGVYLLSIDDGKSFYGQKIIIK